MGYRQATFEDALTIATLHAESWRVAYRGAYRDEFLDGDVMADRAAVWEARLSAPLENQFVVIAEEAGGATGFACAYGREDASWGTLLDNLHVDRERYGRGTGSGLMLEVATWCRANYPDCGVYLWVLAQNDRARRFYEGMGASDAGSEVSVPPGGGQITGHRYVWETPERIAPRSERA